MATAAAPAVPAAAAAAAAAPAAAAAAAATPAAAAAPAAPDDGGWSIKVRGLVYTILNISIVRFNTKINLYI